MPASAYAAANSPCNFPCAPYLYSLQEEIAFMADTPTRANRATIEDVARRVGVHRSTVSRALRGDIRITPETRDRIQRIADEFNYEPNLLAKGLAGGGTGTIGILTPRLQDGFYVTIVSRQQELLLTRGYSPLMGITQGGSGPEERQAIANLVSRGVDGLIVNHVPGIPETNDMLMRLAAGGLPVGMLGIHHLKGIDCVGYDTSSMVESLMRHLFGLGHRRIGIIAWSTHSRRVVGYQQALQLAQIRYRRDYVYILEDTQADLAPLARQILAKPDRPSAMVAIDDNMAARLVIELESLGARVPQDISVVGFDDSWFSTLCRIPLTTMRLPQKAMGQALVDLLLERIAMPVQERAQRAQRVDFTGELIIRNSSAPPPNAL